MTLGLGSVIASLFDAAPWIAALGQHKPWLFGGSGVLLALNYWLVVVRSRRCAPGELCHMDTRFMRLNRRLYWLSLIIFLAAVGITLGGVLVTKWIES